MGRKATAAELRTELRLLKRARMAGGIVLILQSLIKWGGLVFIVYFGYLTVAVLAGKHTEASIGIKVLGNIRISEALAWLLALGSATYGGAQRKLRRDVVERLHSRNKELERALDPRRSSSQLTPRGNTKPEDKP